MLDGDWSSDVCSSDLGEYAIAFEIIDDNVIHRVSSGSLKNEYIDEIFNLQNQVLESTGLYGKAHYFLQGLTELEGVNLKTRKNYFKKWSEFSEKDPFCQMNVIYGGNRATRAGLSISSALWNMKIHVADTPEEAIQWIAGDKEKTPEPSKKNKETLPAVEMDKIKAYADELIYFLGNINWEVDGFNPGIGEKTPDHPFKVVYDAVSLIKMDIDDLFREREKTQIALIEGEEVARALLNATSDSSLLIRTDGTILSANETFARKFGRSPASLRNENVIHFIDPTLTEHRMIQIKKAVITGKPVRFEDEDLEEGRSYDNTIYPVFSAEGRVERLALYTRDITDVKKAEKHIQALTQEIIKAQENERQRIARDLHDNVAQDLASLIISSDTLFEGFPDIPLEVRRRTMKFSRILKKSISSIRDLAYDLRPPSLDQLGLVRTLAQYCTEFMENNMISVDFYSAGLDKLDLDFDTEINLYRLIQEALNNVRKHSGASLVTIRLVASFPEIILRIEDDGNGFDPVTRIIEALNEKRMGLKSMEERVKLLKGEFTIRSRNGEGTMILVKLPYGQGIDSWENPTAVNVMRV
jgi:PAS domain S-box-containing protein